MNQHATQSELAFTLGSRSIASAIAVCAQLAKRAVLLRCTQVENLLTLSIQHRAFCCFSYASLLSAEQSAWASRAGQAHNLNGPSDLPSYLLCYRLLRALVCSLRHSLV